MVFNAFPWIDGIHFNSVLLCRRSLLPLGVLVVIGILVLTIWGTDASNNQEKAVLLPIRDNGGFAGGLISSTQ